MNILVTLHNSKLLQVTWTLYLFTLFGQVLTLEHVPGFAVSGLHNSRFQLSFIMDKEKSTSQCVFSGRGGGAGGTDDIELKTA